MAGAAASAGYIACSIMLNRAPADLQEQMGYTANTDEGCGLLRHESSLVPFVNRFAKNTNLSKAASFVAVGRGD